MRITGYRTLTTVQEWGRPVGDANGLFTDGTTSVPIIQVDTDEGITGIGFGSHVQVETIFAAIEGEDPRCVTALYDRMLRRAFKAGHGGAVFWTIGARQCCLPVGDQFRMLLDAEPEKQRGEEDGFDDAA